MIISFDTETHLIKKGLSTPKMVCLSFAFRENGKLRTGLHTRDEGLIVLHAWLTNTNVTMVGHNIFYDLGVACAERPDLIPFVFNKLEAGLIRDTMVRQQLIDIAQGELKFFYDEDTGEISRSSYHLSDLSYRLLRKFLKKEDTWRLKYALLDGVPLEDWPEEAKKYAIGDAVTTLEVFEAQEKIAGEEIPNTAEQHQAAWALHLMSVWGVRTDAEAVGRLKTDLAEDFEASMACLRTLPYRFATDAPVIKQVKEKGKYKDVKDTKAIKALVETSYAARGQDVPMTEPSDSYPQGQTSMAKKTLLEAAKPCPGNDVGWPELKLLSEAGALQKLLTTYIPVLESGAAVPINARYNVLLETGRTSCGKPNLQNPPRKGGVRECFVPRKGWVFAFSDYDTLELRSLAQVCLDILGHSSMAEALRRGDELHLALAAQMLGIPLEEATKRFGEGDAQIDEYRQQAKPANFGFPGGMAAESFREYAEGYGIVLTSAQAAKIHGTWFATWPEMREYFKVVSGLDERGDPVRQLRSGRIRGGAGYCAIANGFFQGLAADLAKEALWRVAKECYVNKTSPLYGCRPVLFLHDEIGIEIPYDMIGPERASAAADRLSQVMIESASPRWIPDVPITCKPVMVRRWLKGAKGAFVGKTLVPSKPKVVFDKEGKKKTVWEADL